MLRLIYNWYIDAYNWCVDAYNIYVDWHNHDAVLEPEEAIIPMDIHNEQIAEYNRHVDGYNEEP